MQEATTHRTARNAAALREEHQPAEEPTLGGMQASNRRLASEWPLGARPGSGDEHPAPIAKLAVDSVFASACRNSLLHQWSDLG